MSAPIRIDPASLVSLREGSLDAADAARLADALRVKPGARSWATRAALVERDRLICEFAATYYPGLCRNQRSVRIHAELARYASTTWVRTRADFVCRHRDDRRGLIWQILKTRSGHVPCSRLINDILAGRS